MKKILTLLIIVIALTTIPSQGHAQQEDLQKEFMQAKKLIESNCATCMKNTKEGLHEGIDKLEKVIASGYKDKVAAYKLLVWAYQNMAVYAPDDSDEQKEAIKKRNEAYQILIPMVPDDPEILYEYAYTLTDIDLKLTTLKKIIAINPQHAFARFGIGNILIKKGEVEKGIAEMKVILKFVDEEQLESFFGDAIIEIFNQHGHTKEAKEIEILVDRARKYELGLVDIRHGDVDKGIKFIKDHSHGNLNNLSDRQKSGMATALEKRERYKEAAEIYEMIKVNRDNKKLNLLREKAKIQKDSIKVE